MIHTCKCKKGISLQLLTNIKYSPEEIFSHVEFITVEENSWNVTADKYKNNADENEGKVDLTANRTVCS